ncbi:MAG: hypothetical protein MJZ98_04685 [Paludibacteraceae bacterium]|nr:hypothetical protein [Paludibacteraceae bacterium]
MKREEAIARGITVSGTKHSMLRRTPWHDYSLKGTYMLTLVVENRKPVFGRLKGSTAAGIKPFVELSPLGLAIRDEEIKKIHRFYPQVEVWKLCIMPDHLHIILRVREDLPAGKHLGMVIRGFKAGCSRAYWRLFFPASAVPAGETAGTVAIVPSASPEGFPYRPGNCNGREAEGRDGLPGNGNGRETAGTVATVPSASPEGRNSQLPVLFEAGYNDKILLHEGQLDNWKHYLEDNPRRLMVKREHPQLFTVLSGLDVAGVRCQAVGNRFLLDIPDKVGVIVHRRYTDEENARLREAWLSCGERGGVLVSAAIASKEKEVMREAMERGYRIILLRENGFPPIYKPIGESFEACASGQMLQISPWAFHTETKAITREQCLWLNEMAEKIAGNQ